MSSPRYDWWSYAKGMIRRYPELQREFAGRETPEDVWTLPATRQREFEAVRRAVAATRAEPDGEWKLELVRLVFWAQSHTLDGAALRVHVSHRTAVRWHSAFIYRVAALYGLMDG